MNIHSQDVEDDKFIAWKPCYSVGHKKIDCQHKKIINKLNDFYEATKNNYLKSFVKIIILQMYDYTEQHFALEEYILSRQDQSKLKKNQTYNHNMEYFTSELKQQVLNDNYNPDEIFAFLKDWWLHHIKNADNQNV